jgi:hypothetical protein
LIDQVIIVGAGFSYNAGLPLQAGFTAELLTAAGFKKGSSKRLVQYLCDFVRDTYHLRHELDPGEKVFEVRPAAWNCVYFIVFRRLSAGRDPW